MYKFQGASQFDGNTARPSPILYRAVHSGNAKTQDEVPHHKDPEHTSHGTNTDGNTLERASSYTTDHAT